MIRDLIIQLSRGLCLILVLATGFGGIAFAGHDGSHGSHCIDPGQKKASASHSHSADKHEMAADVAAEDKEQSCVQHSCVAVVATLSIEARTLRLASNTVILRGHLLRASLSVESLHRPPIA